jgi:hypothetical protein
MSKWRFMSLYRTGGVEAGSDIIRRIGDFYRIGAEEEGTTRNGNMIWGIGVLGTWVSLQGPPAAYKGFRFCRTAL